MREELIADQGGIDTLSVAKLALIEMIARDVYFLDETDRRIFRVLYKAGASERAAVKLGKPKHPKLLTLMYSYRSPIANNLAKNLLALGLDKPPPKVQTLAEILAEDEEQPEAQP